MRINLTIKSQSGLTLPIAMLALLVILIASAGLIRSMDTSMQVAGKLSFKQDATNQAERARLKVIALFNSGALSTALARESDLASGNYYASIQPSHDTGLPNVLMNTSTFDSTFGSNNITDSSAQITVRYIVERLCFDDGPVSITNCLTSSLNADIGGDAMNLGNQGKVSGNDTPVYRLSIRVTGPLNTTAFMQSEYAY